MAETSGMLRYVAAAFNARPFGMVVAPNWVGLAAVAMLGLANPGFWVLGAGLELGYLLMLATNDRFRRVVDATTATEAGGDDWTARVARALLDLTDGDRRRYQSIAERCRSIIELQEKQSSAASIGLEAQHAGLARLTWMYLRLLLARQAIDKVHGQSAPAQDLAATVALLERRLATEQLTDELRRSIEGQADILRQRINHRGEAERQMTYIDAELTRIEHQVELIREQAALSTDPVLLSRRIDEIAATLGGTSQWIRDQQQLIGAMDDLLIDAAPPVASARARELE
jgi:hypothetical protein